MLARLYRHFTYDDWANRQALAALRRAEPAPTRAVMRLAHVLAAQYLWLARLNREAPPMAVWPRFTLEECGGLIDELPAVWGTFLEGAGEAGLAERVAYTNSKGESFTSRAGDVVEHVLLHGAYHRGQIAADLRTAGHEPPYTDFIHWVRTVEGPR